MLDLGAVLDHEEPLPHPAGDQAQQRGLRYAVAARGLAKAILVNSVC
jgi:hypothetical protein